MGGIQTGGEPDSRVKPKKNVRIVTYTTLFHTTQKKELTYIYYFLSTKKYFEESSHKRLYNEVI